MPGFQSYQSLPVRTKNLIFAGGLTGFVGAVYIYTMKAVGGTDELQNAIDTLEIQKNQRGSSASGSDSSAS